MYCYLLPVFLLLIVNTVSGELSDEDFAELLLREGTKISDSQDLNIWNIPPSLKRTKRAYWGFDKLFYDAVEATNDVSRLGQMIGGLIKENTQFDRSDDYYDYDYEYAAPSYLVGSHDGYGHKKHKKKSKKKKVIEICSSSNSGIFAFFSLGTLMLNATINFMFNAMVNIMITATGVGVGGAVNNNNNNNNKWA